jgi:IS5 family transposase
LCRSKSGGLTTKIDARVDAKGRPVRLLISPGNDHDVIAAEALLDGLEPGAVVIADKGYDTDSVHHNEDCQGGNTPESDRVYRPER